MPFRENRVGWALPTKAIPRNGRRCLRLDLKELTLNVEVKHEKAIVAQISNLAFHRSKRLSEKSVIVIARGEMKLRGVACL